MIAMLQRYVSLPLAILLGAYLYPLYGILFLDWHIFELLLLFWMEFFVIGLFNALKLATNRAHKFYGYRLYGKSSKSLIVIGYITSFFGWTYGYGISLIVLFAPKEIIKQTGFVGYPVHIDVLLDNGVSTALSLLFVSHAVTFYTDYICSGDYQRLSLEFWKDASIYPALLMNIGFFGGGILLSSFDQPTAGMILLLFLKIGISINTYQQQKKFAAVAAQGAAYYPLQARHLKKYAAQEKLRKKFTKIYPTQKNDRK